MLAANYQEQISFGVAVLTRDGHSRILRYGIGWFWRMLRTVETLNRHDRAKRLVDLRMAQHADAETLQKHLAEIVR